MPTQPDATTQLEALLTQLVIPPGVFAPNDGSRAMALAALDAAAHSKTAARGKAAPSQAAAGQAAGEEQKAALNEEAPAGFVEIGCGSGLVSLWLVQHGYRGVAADVSTAAVQTTRDGAKRLGLELQVVQSDLLEGIQGKFGLVLFNPGSQSADDDTRRGLKDGVQRLLPAWSKLALSRLYQRANRARRRAFLGRFVQQARDHLSPGGTVLMNVLTEDVAWMGTFGPARVLNELPRTAIVELRPA